MSQMREKCNIAILTKFCKDFDQKYYHLVLPTGILLTQIILKISIWQPFRQLNNLCAQDILITSGSLQPEALNKILIELKPPYRFDYMTNVACLPTVSYRMSDSSNTNLIEEEVLKYYIKIFILTTLK